MKFRTRTERYSVVNVKTAVQCSSGGRAAAAGPDISILHIPIFTSDGSPLKRDGVNMKIVR